MQTEENKNCIHESVLIAIKAREIKMRPRWQFVLRGTLAVLGGILIALTLLYLVSLIIFASRESGAAFVSSFGFRGFLAFLRALPWLLIAFSVLFIVLLEILVKRYSFAYRKPLVYSACGIIVLVVAGGFVIAGTSFHRMLSDEKSNQGMPHFAQRLYRSFGDLSFSDIYRGVIVSTTTNGFIVHGRLGRPMMILVNSETREQAMSGLDVGEAVVVFGPNASDSVQAIGIQEIGDDE